MNSEFGRDFGTFGGLVADTIKPLVDELGGYLEPEHKVQFEETLLKINDTVDRLFSDEAHRFIEALAGFLAFKGTNGYAMHESDTTGSVVNMAINSHRILNDIFARSLDRAEEHFSHALAEESDVGEVVADMVEQLLNVDGWDVVTEEHPLSDLLFGKKKEGMQA